jgi:hypothetical protein
MRLEFTYTAVDLQEMAQAAAKPENARQSGALAIGKSRNLFGWVIFIGLAVVLFIFLQNRSVTVPPATPLPAPKWGVLEWATSFVPWLLVFGFIWFFVYRQMRNLSPRSVYEHTSSMQQPKSLDITDAGVRMSDALASTEWRWESFTGLVETANLLLLRQADNTFVIIPKRAVPAAELDALRYELQSHIPAPGAFPVLPPKP